MKTFDQILAELLGNLRSSNAAGFVPATPGQPIPLPPRSELPAPRTPTWPSAPGAPPAPRESSPVESAPSPAESSRFGPLRASTRISTLVSGRAPEPTSPPVPGDDSESIAPSAPPATLRVPPVSSPDYSRLYSAPRCQWGGPGAYVPMVPLLPAPASTGNGDRSRANDELPRRQPRAVSPHSDRELADCRTLLDRPEDDEFGTRVFRIFD